MKAYKVFEPDWTCKGFKYAVGKTYTMSEMPVLCSVGFHACKRAIDCFQYYDFNPKNKVAEVELLGDIVGENGDKQATNEIKIVKEIAWGELLEMVNIGSGNSGRSNSGHSNSGDYNSGHYNSGDYNSGRSNSGHYNSGDSNSGHSNSGHSNSGDYNSGHYNSGRSNSGRSNSGDYNSGDYNSGDSNSGRSNSGDYNSGHYNSGRSNSGHSNSGDYNSGRSNSGDYNSGRSNSGHYNSGDSNSGDYNSGRSNSGDYNSGDFNTKVPEKVYFFNTLIPYNELIEIRNSEAYDILYYRFRLLKYRVRTSTGKYGDYRYLSYKTSFKYFWRNLTIRERKTIINMPYFNAQIFYEITGVKLKGVK
jgi:hypothetical protein